MDKVGTDGVGTPLGNALELLRRLQSGELTVFPPPTPPVYWCSTADEPAMRRELGLEASRRHQDQGKG